MITKELILHNSIMATDVYLCASSETIPEDEIESDLLNIVEILRNFEQRYSRFIKNNYLWEFNHSKKFKTDSEFFEILTLCRKYFEKTDGIYDPTILSTLISEGYQISKHNGFLGEPIYEEVFAEYNFGDVELNSNSSEVNKPQNLYIDLGGIGKGYAVNKIKKILEKKYGSFCVSLGGDMYLGSKDEKEGYDYWAIEIENPINPANQPTLLLSDISVATSGTYKRNWERDGEEKSHIIDPISNRSKNTDIISSTVIDKDPIFCDVMAKFFLIIDLEKSLEYCQNNKCSAVFIRKNGKITYTEYAKKYIWSDK